jgi:hypothetical protein
LAVVAGCATNPCDRNAQVDYAKKASACEPAAGAYLGDKAACGASTKGCSGSDQSALVSALDCLDALPVCDAAAQATWTSSRDACAKKLAGLSAACRSAFVYLPGLDAPPDAGLWPADDGGNGVELIGVADETSFAFAWSTVQPAPIASWVLSSVDEAGVREDLAPQTAGVTALLLSDAGSPRRWFLAGLDSTGALAFGVVDAGAPPLPSDAGAAECHAQTDCDVDHVCDLNACVTLACGGSAAVCPQGYDCPVDHCVRAAGDGGVVDAGQPVIVDAGPPPRPLPCVSQSVSLARGAPGVSPTVSLGGFAGRRADVAALDSARVVAVLEQDGQIVAHFSSRRGRDFPSDKDTAGPVDTLGSRPHVTWNPESRAIFTCYAVGRGVRVRVSLDEGRTWGAGAATIELPEDDAGVPTLISDCDLAPWKNGGALLVTVDGDRLVVRTVSTSLDVGAPETALRSSTPGPTGVWSPVHPAIATLPADGLVHVTFTGTRQLSTGSADTEIYGIFKDSAASPFSAPVFLKPGFGAIAPGTSLPQDWSTVVIEPKSKRALAAYVSQEGGSGGTTSNTVYVALWSPGTRTWGTGSDLSVFAIDSKDNVTTILFPQKQQTDVWDAFSPSLSVLPSGRLFLTFVAGPRPQAYGDYRLYALGFDLDTISPVSNGKGWFVPPVKPLSSARVLAPSNAGGAPPEPVSAAACDGQLSLVGVFAEGLGANGEQPAHVLFTTSP